MTEDNRKFARELTIGSLCIFLTAAFSLAAWGLTDRLHWAAKEQQIEDTAQTVNDIKTKLDSVPENFVTRQEFEQVRQMIQTDHAETITAIGHLGDRIDRLATMDGLPRGSVRLSPMPGGAAVTARTDRNE